MILAVPPVGLVLMQAVIFAIPAIAILAAAGWYTSYCLSQRSFANKLASGGPDSVGTVGPGDEVLLEGRAQPTEADGTIEAPATGEDCLAHEFEVERRSARTGPSSDGPDWGREAVGGRSVPFLLDADGGQVLVEPAAGVGKLKEQTNLEVYGNETTVAFDPEEQSGRIGHLFEKWDDVHEETERRRKVEERSLRPGETATVSGVLREPHEVDRVVPPEATYVVGPRRESGGSGLSSLAGYPVFKVGDDAMEDLASELHRGARWGLGIGGVGLLLGLVGLGGVLLSVAPVVSLLL